MRARFEILSAFMVAVCVMATPHVARAQDEEAAEDEAGEEASDDAPQEGADNDGSNGKANEAEGEKAEDLAADDAEAEKDDKRFDFGIGLIGSFGGNFLDKPERDNNPDIYPGFGGITAGGGLLIDFRFFDVVGVEVDVIRSSDKGNGTVTLNGVDFDITIGQSAWHVPVLAKVTLPTPLIALSFFVGPEFVIPGDAESEVDPNVDNFQATADSYTMVTGGLGLEVKLPLPVIDLRIPAQLRAHFNPGVPGEFNERVQANLATNTLTYDSEWKYAFTLTAGAGIYF